MLHASLKRMAAFLKKYAVLYNLIYAAAVAGYEKKSSIVAVQSAQLSSSSSTLVLETI